MGPAGDVHERDEGGDLDERADDTGEGLAGGDAEHADGHRDRELELLPAAVNATWRCAGSRAAAADRAEARLHINAK